MLTVRKYLYKSRLYEYKLNILQIFQNIFNISVSATLWVFIFVIFRIMASLQRRPTFSNHDCLAISKSLIIDNNPTSNGNKICLWPYIITNKNKTEHKWTIICNVLASHVVHSRSHLRENDMSKTQKHVLVDHNGSTFLMLVDIPL